MAGRSEKSHWSLAITPSCLLLALELLEYRKWKVKCQDATECRFCEADVYYGLGLGSDATGLGSSDNLPQSRTHGEWVSVRDCLIRLACVHVVLIMLIDVERSSLLVGNNVTWIKSRGCQLSARRACSNSLCVLFTLDLTSCLKASALISLQWWTDYNIELWTK